MDELMDNIKHELPIVFTELPEEDEQSHYQHLKVFIFIKY